MRTILRAMAWLCMSTGAATVPALAQEEGFRICNRSGQDVELATAVDLGEQGGAPGTYLSKGWYDFAAGQCFVMWPSPLQHRFYFVYAQNKQTGREWKGDTTVCVSREPFELSAPGCAAGGYGRPFLRIDTGNSAGWTYNILP